MDLQSLLQIGIQHQDAGRLKEAADIYRQILQIQPDCIDAVYLSGLLAYQSARHEAAAQLLRRVVTDQPAHYNSNFFLGMALLKSGQSADAVNFLRKAAMLANREASPRYYLALAELQCGMLVEAGETVLEALAIDPGRQDIATLFRQIFGRVVYLADDATMVRLYGQVFAMQPSAPALLLYAVAVMMFDNGHHELSVAAFREVIRRHPDCEIAHAALIDSLFLHAPDQEAAFAELKNWHVRHAEPLRRHIRSWETDKDADRKLRIGFLSLHIMDANTFLTVWPGWFEGYDRTKFEIYIYVDELQKYETVRPFTDMVDVNRNTAGMSDEALADLIRQDRIDILVDIYGRGPINRMRVLARKPAPIQVAWGPISTGMNVVDYFISDRVAIPESRFHRYEERVVWLPHSYIAWVPPAEPIEVSERPVDVINPVVFSAFNRAIKMTPITLDLWARTMAAVENSRLLMKGSIGDRPQLQQKVLAALEVRGVDPQRVSFLPGGDRPSHLAAYRHVDIQLDTVPEQGGITTLESFWCGVPVVTWRYDDRILTRSGATICTTLRLPELIADSPEAFVSIARNLANDREKLKGLRASLRSRMEMSPLLDLQRYTQSLQAAFQEMWRRYCAGMPPQHFDVATLLSH